MERLKPDNRRRTPSLFFKRIFFPGFNLGVRTRKSLCRFFLKEDGIRTLDIGCGNGYFTIQAVRRGGTALGISFDEDQIARCDHFKASLGLVSEKLEFLSLDAKGLRSLNERFGQVLLLEVLEHLDDDAAVLRDVGKLLKPGGVLHITTPDIRLGRWVGTLDRMAAGGHCRLGYSSDRLESLVREAGLDVVYAAKLGGLGNFLGPLQNSLSRTLGGSLSAQGIAFLAVYPIYRLLQIIPVPDSMRMYNYLIARKRLQIDSDNPASRADSERPN